MAFDGEGNMAGMRTKGVKWASHSIKNARQAQAAR
jgi:hypothetical protein